MHSATELECTSARAAKGCAAAGIRVRALASEIEDAVPPGTPGCADGFAVDTETGLLLASCAGGLCVVDPDAGKVVARMHTTEQGWRVSNVAISGATAFLTTERGIWTLPLDPRRGEAAHEEL